MKDTRAARRYAQALYEVAVVNGSVEAVESDLNSFEELVAKNVDFHNFLMAPYTSRPTKIQILESLLGGKVNPLSLQVVKIMIAKGREREIGLVRDEFTKLRRAKTNVVHAHITSAIALSETQKIALNAKLEKVIGMKIEADYGLDPSMMGGIKVAYNDNAIDGSVRGSLNKLRDQFKHDILKQA